MTKRLWALLLCLALAFGTLTGCGGEEGGTENVPGEVAPGGDDEGEGGDD
jgi:predicted small lipoprotein YifL